MKPFKNFLRVWGKKTLNALFFGFVVFATLSLLSIFKDEPAIPVSLGCFVAYMILGRAITKIDNYNLDDISQAFKWKNLVYKFCLINIAISLVMIVSGIISFFLWPGVIITTWPLLSAGIVLFLASVYGAFNTLLIAVED